MLDAITRDQPMRGRLEKEALELTDIFNAHLLRNSEMRQSAIFDVDQVDYLFHRMFAMIHLLLKKRLPLMGMKQSRVRRAPGHRH